MKSLTIELLNKNILVRGELDGISSPSLKITTNGPWADSELVGVLLSSYLRAAESFLQIHGCTDCLAYQQHKKNFDTLIIQQKEIMMKVHQKVGN